MAARWARPCGGLAALVAGSLAFAALGLSASVGQAHEAKPAIVPDDRVELSFGRTEEYDYEPPAPGSYRLPPIKAAGDGQVLNSNGRERRLHELFDGRITVLAFIYTRCADPQGCPLSLGLLYDLAHVAARDPVIGDSLRLIALSFDPAHDTAEIMARYATGMDQGSEAAPMFLTTRSAAKLGPILEAYNQPIGRKTDADDPFGPFTHQLRVYLIGRDKDIRNIYSLGFLDPRLVITDIRTLLLEEREEPFDG